MLKEFCAKRNLTEIWDNKSIPWDERRSGIINLFLEEEYGKIPYEPDELYWEIEDEDSSFCAGKVTLSKVKITVVCDGRKSTFPVYASVPNRGENIPFFVHINFKDSLPDIYLPIEEICDNGFAVLSFCYQDVSVDNVSDDCEKYTEGLNEVFFGNTKKEGNHCGKIALWAWAASRVLDYAQTIERLDHSRAAVVGHSRLGKTALLAGAMDTRFSCVISNNSGCSGAAVSRMKDGEKIRDIMEVFPYWFCDNYKKYIDNEENLPFDQHYLIAAIAPRRVYVASAEEDKWADPVSEFLGCCAAGEVYEKLGLSGLVCPDKLPEPEEYFHEGNIGYHLRKGTHYLSREDWLFFMKYLKKQNNM